MEKAFFITGMARSGTTLLERMLNNHPEIAVCPESNFFQILNRLGAEEQFSKSWQYPSFIKEVSQWLSNYNDPALEVIKTYFKQNPSYKGESLPCLQALVKAYLTNQNKRIFAEKHPNHIYYQRSIHRICPDAKLIFMLRHPLDIVCSTAKLLLLSQNKDMETYSDNILLQSSLFVKRGVRAIFKSKGFPEKGKYMLKLEELLTEPEKNLKALCTFLEVPYDSKLIDVNARNYVNPQKTGMNIVHKKLQQGLDSQHIFVYRQRLSPKQKALLTRFLRKELAVMGYSVEDEASPISIGDQILLLRYYLTDFLRPYAWKEAFLRLKLYLKFLLRP